MCPLFLAQNELNALYNNHREFWNVFIILYLIMPIFQVMLCSRRHLFVVTAQNQNNHTEIVLIKSLLGH